MSASLVMLSMKHGGSCSDRSGV